MNPDGKRGLNWEMVTGVVAIGIGALALIVSSYTAYLQRRQAEAAVWPHLELYKSTQPTFRVLLANKGVGPALIKRAELRFEGKPVRTWGELMRAASAKPGPIKYTQTTIVGRVLSANEQMEAVVPGDEAVPRLESAFSRLSATICYCSIFEDCWAWLDGRTEAIKSCAGAAETSFKE